MPLLYIKLTIYLKKFYQYLNKFLTIEYQRLDLWYFISFICGIICFFQYDNSHNFLKIIIIFLLIISLVIIFFNFLIIRFFLLLILFFISAYLVCLYKISFIKIPQFKDGIMVDITGEINDIRILRKGVEGIIKINSINTNLKLPKIRIKFLNNNDLLVGQKIKCRIKIFNIKQNNLSHRSKFFLISYMNKIYARGYLVGPIEEIGINKSFKYYIYILHQNIYQRLIKNLGKQCGNLVAAFLLGEGKAIDNKLLKDLRSAGVSHLICISGLHLSLVSMIFFSSIRFILNMFDCIVYKYNVKIMATSITLISTYAYLLLSGSQIAASRAFILTTIYIFSIMLMRRMSILRGLGLAALILLIDCPAYVFHPSFQLSFTAVLSLLAGFEIPYSNKLKKGHNILYRMRSYIINNIYSSFLAGVVIAPFIIQNFRVFPTYSVLSNLVAVPLMSFCLMPIGLFGVFSMLINAELLPLSLLKVFVNCLINIIVYTNKLPHATYYIGYLPNSIFIIFLMSFFWLCIWKTKIRLLGIIGILIFIISLI